MSNQSMKDVLDLLVRIQAYDDEIEKAKILIEQIPNKIIKLEKEIEIKKIDLENRNARIIEIKKIYKLREGELADNENKISKLNSQTFDVRTNEEYRAILNEIDYIKKENAKIEDAMIDLLEEEEKLKNTIDQYEDEAKEYIRERTKKIDDLKSENESLKKKQHQTKINFEADFNKLPNDVRELYKRISKVRGRAVCLITDNTCTGCYSNLTHQFLNELKKRNNILLCDNCGRILIYAFSDEK